MPDISFTVDLVPAALLFVLASMVAFVVVAAFLDRLTMLNRIWAGATFSLGAGMLLLLSRGPVPEPLSILLGNLLIFAAQAGLAAGARRYVGRSVGLPCAIAAAGAIVFATAYGLGAGLEARIALFSALCCTQSIIVVLAFLEARRHWAAGLVAAAFAMTALLAAARLAGVFGLIEPPGGVDLLHAALLNYGVMLALGLSLGLIAVNLPMLRTRLVAPAPASAPAPDQAWLLLPGRSALLAPNGAEVKLTGSEYLLLRELAGASATVARTALIAAIGRDPENPKDRSIDILISRLRRKCAEAGLDLPVTAVRGMGYVFHGPLRNGGG